MQFDVALCWSNYPTCNTCNCAHINWCVPSTSSAFAVAQQIDTNFALHSISANLCNSFGDSGSKRQTTDSKVFCYVMLQQQIAISYALHFSRAATRSSIEQVTTLFTANRDKCGDREMVAARVISVSIYTCVCVCASARWTFVCICGDTWHIERVKRIN